jgi:hypothetical protein
MTNTSDWKIPAGETAVIFQPLKQSENGKIISGRSDGGLPEMGGGRKKAPQQRGADGFLPR